MGGSIVIHQPHPIRTRVHCAIYSARKSTSPSNIFIQLKNLNIISACYPLLFKELERAVSRCIINNYYEIRRQALLFYTLYAPKQEIFSVISNNYGSHLLF